MSVTDSEYESMLNTLRELCRIPAPSYHEDGRAAYIKAWLENAGAAGVYIDEALNVIFETGPDDEGMTVFSAHTDTVFPDLSPMPVIEDDAFIASPGVGDDTASVVVLLYAIKRLLGTDALKDKHVMFVFNSCEEGLGNLMGVKHLFEKFGTKIKKYVAFDSTIGIAVDHAVGSVRYKVTVRTEGGHSFNRFGNVNAIAVMSEIVNRIYSIEVPDKEGAKTTFNVGTISGGTSVNTIAQEAEMLCEYRSSDASCMEIMEQRFDEIFESCRNGEAEITVKCVGNRPGMGDVSEEEMSSLRSLVSEVNKEFGGVEKTEFNQGSTDCNVPLSLGIPAICVGVYNGSAAHTREEKVEKGSLKAGLEIAVELIGKITT